MRKQFSSLSHLAFISTAVACNLFGCAAKVDDLGNSDSKPAAQGPIYSTGVPTAPASAGTDSGVTASGMSAFRIVDMEQTGCDYGGGLGCSASAFMVDSGRLLWLSPSIDPTDQELNYYLRSCGVDNCAGTLTSSARHRDTGNSMGTQMYWMQKVGDQVYWGGTAAPSVLVDGNSNSAPNSAIAPSVLTVNSAPGSTIEAATSVIDFSGIPVLDNGFLCWVTSQNTLLRCDLTDCVNRTESFAITEPSGAAPFDSGSIVAYDDEYVYLVDSGASTANTRIARLKKDMSAPFEVILPSIQTHPSVFGVDGDTLYWVEDIVGGRLFSCPNSGCVGAPTVLMTGLNRPTDLVVDSSFLYVLESPLVDTSASPSTVDYAYGATCDSLVRSVGSGSPGYTVTRPGRILKCPLTGCSNPTVIYATSDEYVLDKIRLDDRFVYFHGMHSFTFPGSPPGSSTFPVLRRFDGFIGAVPK